MPPTKRPIMEGSDDGEGYRWKTLKAKDGAIDVFYGHGSASRFQLKKADKKTAPTEQLVLQRIAEHRDAKRKQQDDDEGGGGGKKAKGSRLAAEAAAVTSEAESSMSPSGSKEKRSVLEGEDDGEPRMCAPLEEVIKYFEDCLAEGRGTAAVDQMFQRAISFTLQAEQEKLDNALQVHSIAAAIGDADLLVSRSAMLFAQNFALL